LLYKDGESTKTVLQGFSRALTLAASILVVQWISISLVEALTASHVLVSTSFKADSRATFHADVLAIACKILINLPKHPNRQIYQNTKLVPELLTSKFLQIPTLDHHQELTGLAASP